MGIRKVLNFALIPFVAVSISMGLWLKEDRMDSLKLKGFQDIGNSLEKLSIESSISNLGEDIDQLNLKATEIHVLLEKNQEAFNLQLDKITSKIDESDSQRKLSDDIYEQKILDILGQPIKTHLSENNEIKVYELKELGYRGYIAKVKLFNPDSFKVVMGNDILGGLERTSSSAKRKNGILAINGGGFGKRVVAGKTVSVPIGTTVIDGKFVTSVIAKSEKLFFSGINKDGQVIGTVPNTLEDIKELDPYQGVSFIPALIRNYEKLQIPSKWKSTKHPRTIIGKYANDDLILIVIDGRQGNWSSGASLERVQDKLLELGVKEAYNLDGGGSSIMYYDGKILNKPSDGSERPVANSIVILP
jgi:exopolysaccharide biosynthesis protein